MHLYITGVHVLADSCRYLAIHLCLDVTVYRWEIGRYINWADFLKCILMCLLGAIYTFDLYVNIHCVFDILNMHYPLSL